MLFYIFDKENKNKEILERNLKDLQKKERFENYLFDLNNLSSLLSKFNFPVTMLVEDAYIDKMHRDLYYLHYSAKFHNIKRNCLRLIFFEGKISNFNTFINNNHQAKLIGSIVLRPIRQGNIGHTLIDPAKIHLRGSYIVCENSIMILGTRFTIEAFPFCAQDTETMSCTETVLYNILEYFGQRYSTNKTIMPSEIFAILKSNNHERVLPTKGINQELFNKVFYEKDFSPLLYSKTILKKNIKKVIYSYIMSGIPVALFLKKNIVTPIKGISRHTITCIGIENNNEDISWNNQIIEQSKIKCPNQSAGIYILNIANLIHTYIVMDDNLIPYENIEINDSMLGEDNRRTGNKKQNTTIDYVSVPLYKRIFMDALDAESIIYEFLKKGRFIEELKKVYEDIFQLGTKNNPFLLRIYLTSARNFKIFKKENTKGYRREDFCLIKLPHFIWVAEITTKSDYLKNQGLAEIILDATATNADYENSILGIIYSNHFICNESEKFSLTHLDNMIYNCKYIKPTLDRFVLFSNNLKRRD